MQVSEEENADGGRQGAVAVGSGKKMYYSISEVCAMTGIGQHVLRYWEKEFSLLRPKKNSGGKRAYKEKDIEAIIKIKRMLDEEKYTLQGAKARLLDERRELRAAGSAAVKKRGKANAADGGKRLDPTKPPTEDTATSSMSIPAGIPAKRAKRNFVRDDNDGNVDGDGNHNAGGDSALLLSIRDELSKVLRLLAK